MKKLISIIFICSWVLLFPLWAGPSLGDGGAAEAYPGSSGEGRASKFEEKARKETKEVGNGAEKAGREVKESAGGLPERAGKEMKQKMKEGWKSFKDTFEKQNGSDSP